MEGRADQKLDPGSRYAFLHFVLDPARETLVGPEGEIALRPKSFAVLSYLLANAGRVCTKDELLGAVWGTSVVTEDSLAQCLVEIRRALSDQGRDIIRTVTRRGYLLNVEVRCLGSELTAVDTGFAPAESIPEPAVSVETSPAAGKAAVSEFLSRIPAAARVGLVFGMAGFLLVGLMVFMNERPDPPNTEVGAALIEPTDDAALPPFTAEEIAARGTTVAVLPFADMSPAGDHAYLGDGMADEILNLLTEAEGLRVIARTSSFSLRDKQIDVRVIGRRLGASHILEGSVRPDGEHVRVTAQLIDAEQGAQLWSETYDRPLGQVLMLQDEIAGSVAAQLHATLVAESNNSRSVDPLAYDHKLRGAYLFSRRRAGDLEVALQHFEAALALEPNYGAAWVGLAGALWVLMLDDGHIEPEELATFREAALQGVELSPDMPEAHMRAAASYGVIGSVAMQERHMELAAEIDPENPLLLGILAGRALRAGNLDQALEDQYRALRRDPLHLVTRSNLVSMLLGAGRVELARREYNTIVELGGEDVSQESDLLLLEGRYGEAWERLGQVAEDAAWMARGAMALHKLGREADALAWIERLRGQETYAAAFALAEFESWRGGMDASLEWLRLARERLSLLDPLPSVPTWEQILALSPFLGPLRADHRIDEIAATGVKFISETDEREINSKAVE